MLLRKRRAIPSAAVVLAVSSAVIGSVVAGIAPSEAMPVSTAYATGFVSPSGIAIDNSGNIYVADYDRANSGVTKISVVNGVQVLTPIGTGFLYPLGMAVDAAKNVYVADYGHSRVEKITSAGVQSDVGSGLSFPTAVVVDANSDVYIADVDKIVKVAANGVQTTIASGFIFAKGLAMDSAGDMFVSDSTLDSTSNSYVGSVYRVDHVSHLVQRIATGLAGPEGLTIDPAGNILVADTYANRVLRLTPGSTPTVVISDAYYPMAVAVDAAGRVLTGSLGDPGLRTGKVVATDPATIAAPAVRVTPLSAQQMTMNFAVSWTVPTFANMATVDVRYRTSVGGAALSGYLPLITSSHARTSTFTGATNTRYCFSAMSRTSANVAGAWSTETCTTVPTDDRSLVRSTASAWASTVNAGWLASTGSTATAKGSSLTTAQARTVKSISLVSWTCPTCGVVDVYVGATKVGTVSLAKAGAAKRSLLSPIRLTSARTGKVKVVVTSVAKRVSIDGIAIG